MPVQLLVLAMLAIRLWIQLFAEPDGDEAYYWLWGQHLELSYFDHPPLNAWLQRGMSVIFGWNVVGLRALTWATLAGTLAIFWSFARRLAPGDRWATFWCLSAVYLCSPVFFLMTTAALHDHLMLFLCLASAYFFLRFAERYELGEVRHRDLYLGAALLGFAVLTKYTAAVYGIGVGLFFLLRPQLRPMLATPHPWLAALLSIAVQAPVIWWNVTEGFPTFTYHFDTRWTGGVSLSLENAIQTIPRFIVYSLLTLSPLLIVPMLRGILGEPETPFADRLKSLAVPTFLTSSVLMLLASAAVVIAFYWNILAYLLLFPLAVRFIGRGWQFWGHALLGLAAAVLLAVNTTQVPVAALFGAYDRASAFNFGWRELATEMRAAETNHPGAFLATTRFNSAAQLAFALQDPDVTAIRPETDQFDYWFDPAAHAGRDALILADSDIGIDDAATHFTRVTLLREVPISRQGRPLLTYRIYLGEGYAP
ncbi:MAG TPA: glycosyltransferase family 39 protein [Devosia sp.]